MSQPWSGSVRYVIGAWWIFSIAVVNTYTGNLIAFLAVDKHISPFTSLEELAYDSDFTYGILGGTNYVTYFEVNIRA